MNGFELLVRHTQTHPLILNLQLVSVIVEKTILSARISSLYFYHSSLKNEERHVGLNFATFLYNRKDVEHSARRVPLSVLYNNIFYTRRRHVGEVMAYIGEVI
jgi:hypothetical protein